LLLRSVDKENSTGDGELVATERSAGHCQDGKQNVAHNENACRVLDPCNGMEECVDEQWANDGDHLKDEQETQTDTAAGARLHVRRPARSQPTSERHACHKCCDQDGERLIHIAVDRLKREQEEHLEANQCEAHGCDAEAGAYLSALYFCSSPSCIPCERAENQPDRNCERAEAQSRD